jgi:CheY-like chemotaxis protein
MAKILIVEDDTSLSEIYSIRLQGEGYEVATAADGEEGLAAAIREKPDLIISDVMMPRVSGFDMLDILRSTPATANIKVIMMTALSGDDQRERGTHLGADGYLVKSQVGIEDVVDMVNKLIAEQSAAPVTGGGASVNLEPNAPTAPDPMISTAAPVAEPIAAEAAPAMPEVPAVPDMVAAPEVTTTAPEAPVAEPALDASAEAALATATADLAAAAPAASEPIVAEPIAEPAEVTPVMPVTEPITAPAEVAPVTPEVNDAPVVPAPELPTDAEPASPAE